MSKQETSLKEYLQNNSLPIVLQMVALLVLILNLWLASRLAPISQDILVISGRVSALEERGLATSTDHEDIQVIKEQVIGIRRDVDEMKADIKSLVNKF